MLVTADRVSRLAGLAGERAVLVSVAAVEVEAAAAR